MRLDGAVVNVYRYLFHFQIVTNISNELSEDGKEYIRTETSENKENVKLWGEHIQCHYIPYKPSMKPLANLRVTQATASKFVKDFSMKYTEAAPKPVQESKVSPLLDCCYPDI